MEVRSRWDGDRHREIGRPPPSRRGALAGFRGEPSPTASPSLGRNSPSLPCLSLSPPSGVLTHCRALASPPPPQSRRHAHPNTPSSRLSHRVPAVNGYLRRGRCEGRGQRREVIRGEGRWPFRSVVGWTMRCVDRIIGERTGGACVVGGVGGQQGAAWRGNGLVSAGENFTQWRTTCMCSTAI
jgi:hypothetical protein